MKIQAQTSQQLVIEHQRRGMALTMALFTLLSAFVAVNLVWQGVPRLSFIDNMQIIGWLMWIALVGGFAYIGATAWGNVARSTTCTFDKATETAHIRKPHLWHTDERDFSIYAISHIDVQYNADAKVYGVFVVLRSSERIAIATVPPHAADDARRIARTVRDFLR